MWHLVTAQQWKETFCLTENEARILRQIQREYNRGLYNSIVMLCICKSAASVLFIFFSFCPFFAPDWVPWPTFVARNFWLDLHHADSHFLHLFPPQPREQTCKEQNEWNFPDVQWNPFHFGPVRRASELAWSRSLYLYISLLPGSNPSRSPPRVLGRYCSVLFHIATT